MANGQIHIVQTESEQMGLIVTVTMVPGPMQDFVGFQIQHKLLVQTQAERGMEMFADIQLLKLPMKRHVQAKAEFGKIVQSQA